MAAKKTAKAKQRADRKKAATNRHAKPAKERRMSALDASAKVLAEADGPMNCKELIEAMAEKGYWKSPGGKTPWATLYSALLREQQKKGKEARFTRVDRGRFALVK